MDTCGCELLLKSVRMGTYACGFCTRLMGTYACGFCPSCEGAYHTLSCLHTCPTGREGFDGAVSCKSELSGPRAAFMPSVWRQLLWTFLLFYSVGLWFCLKAPVHRRKPAEEKAFFPRFPSFHCKFFFLLRYVYFHCCLGFLCFGWMYWKVIPFI